MLILKNCTKSFKKTKALNDFSCEFKHGIYGLLGPNGSGKTTMMRCICGLLSPEKGSIECDCENIGYLPQQFGAMKSLTVYETMRYFATLKKIPKSNQDNEIRYCIDLVNLSDKIKNKVGSLSGGMVRRLGIAQAIMGNPEIVLFDEPTAGLDPEERVRFKSLLRKIKNDKTIDRRQVSDVVFSHPELLEKLNQIIHPAVKQYIREQLAVKKQQEQKICVVEAALLLEDHYQEFCDTIWYIHTDEEIRIRRLMENRGYTREKSVSIIASQAPETFFRENADYVVVNNGDFAQTRRQIEEGIRKYETL